MSWREKKMMLTQSVSHFKGKTVEELKRTVDWLSGMSEESVSMLLRLCEESGLIYSKEAKRGFVYYATKKGKQEAGEYFE